MHTTLPTRIPVATIALSRPDQARASLLLTRTQEGIEITGLTPDGPEAPAFPAFATNAAAQEAIQSAYGRAPWDLQWDEMGCQLAARLDAGRGADPITLAAELYGGTASPASAPNAWILTFAADLACTAADRCASWLALALPGTPVHARPAGGPVPGTYQVWVGIS